ncbi:PAS domain-containing sensor histidine kinase [Pyruvatibacter sp. HU-CL02332]|uniref:PAS domain-containing sensor histidine kinase n=1 Tax=Pyruvatibacter sp. HU-CL02332 TaxID=3127650 RepID=UPI00310442D8
MQIADWQVHLSVRGRPRQMRRHASFIRQHLTGGAMGLAGGVLFAVVTGSIDLFAVGAFALLGATALPGLFLRATGQLAASYALSSTFFAILVGWLCLWTGGVDSPAIFWLAIVPMEAALSANRRSAITAAAISSIVFSCLVWMSLASSLPPAHLPGIDPFLTRMVSIVAAIVYACALAMRTQEAYQRAEDAADSEEARYRMVADNASDLITRHSIDGTVLFATPASRRLLNVSPDKLIGSRLSDVPGCTDAEAIADAFTNTLRQGGEATVEFTVPNADGTTRYLETRLRATGNAVDISLIAVTRDITDRQEAHVVMEEARDMAESASRTKSAFLRSMSHELRTPLNSIIGFAQVIRDQSFGPIGNGRYSDYADMIGDSGKTLLRIVTDVLRMSEIEAGNVEMDVEETRLLPIADGAVRTLEPQARHGRVVVINHVSDDLPLALADARAAGQAVNGILANAIQYSALGESIEIEAGSDELSVWLEIKDNGPGIPAHEIDRLMRPFERTGGSLEGRPSGAGVGLAIAKALTELQRGGFSIRSQEGEGTTVRLAFPRARMASRRSA